MVFLIKLCCFVCGCFVKYLRCSGVSADKKRNRKKNFFMGESLKQAPQTIKSAKSIKNSIRINEERKKNPKWKYVATKCDKNKQSLVDFHNFHNFSFTFSAFLFFPFLL